MKVLVVGDYLPALTEAISRNYRHLVDPEAAIDVLRNEFFDVVVTGLHLKPVSGLDILRSLRETHLDPIVIVTSFDKDPKSMMECYDLGAAGFVFEPFEIEELEMMIGRYYLERKNREELERYRKTVIPKEIDSELIGGSVILMRVKNAILQYAPSSATVLLRGESGTGKGVAAGLIHAHSPRCLGPFLSLNCGAIPENLLESELFGYERGAFTGAVVPRTGLFEQAEGGTLFLDEIGELPLPMQVKLLKVLEDKVIRRLGGNREIGVNVRVIAATNKNLQVAIAQKEFREDLFYRLNVLQLSMPALRERRDDVAAVAKSLLEKMSREMNRPNTEFSPEAYAKLTAYPWPGNVRELKNIVERALIRNSSDLLPGEAIDLPAAQNPARSEVSNELSTVSFLNEVSKKGLDPALDGLEKSILTEAMRSNDHNQTRAAKFLSVKRTTLLQKLKRHGLI